MPAVPSFEPQPFSGTIWRMAETQHQASVMKLVDTIEEQALLERLLEETKPALPRECAGFDPLLSAPFRYGAPDPGGSRFRRAGRTLGVFYSAETVEAALADMVYCRLLFFAESPDTPLPSAPVEVIGFAAEIDTRHGLDLVEERSLCAGAPVPDHAQGHGRASDDHASSQAFADAARDAGVEAIRYVPQYDAPGAVAGTTSCPVQRNPAGGVRIALLSPRAFAAGAPVERQRWRIRFAATAISALCDFPPRRIGFSAEDFTLAEAPRLPDAGPAG